MEDEETMDPRVAEVFSFHGDGMTIQQMVSRLKYVHMMDDKSIDKLLNSEHKQGTMVLVGYRLYVG